MVLQKEEVKDGTVLLNPAERVAAVRPMWEQKPHNDRVQLLTVDLETLKQQAKAAAEKQRANEGVQLELVREDSCVAGYYSSACGVPQAACSGRNVGMCGAAAALRHLAVCNT